MIERVLVKFCAIEIGNTIGEFPFAFGLSRSPVCPDALNLLLLAFLPVTSGVASPTIWSCYANFKSSLFISLEIDCFHGL